MGPYLVYYVGNSWHHNHFNSLPRTNVQPRTVPSIIETTKGANLQYLFIATDHHSTLESLSDQCQSLLLFRFGAGCDGWWNSILRQYGVACHSQLYHTINTQTVTECQCSSSISNFPHIRTSVPLTEQQQGALVSTPCDWKSAVFFTDHTNRQDAGWLAAAGCGCGDLTSFSLCFR